MIEIKEHEKICQICEKPIERESLIAQVRYLLYDIDGRVQEVLAINFHVECVQAAARLEELVEQGKEEAALEDPAVKDRILQLLSRKKPKKIN